MGSGVIKEERKRKVESQTCFDNPRVEILVGMEDIWKWRKGESASRQNTSYCKGAKRGGVGGGSLALFVPKSRTVKEQNAPDAQRSCMLIT